MTNYSFSERQRPVDSETFFMTDFVNLKIKLTQSFRGVHRDRIYVRVFIEMNATICKESVHVQVTREVSGWED
jgi:hypothetical protein